MRKKNTHKFLRWPFLKIFVRNIKFQRQTKINVAGHSIILRTINGLYLSWTLSTSNGGQFTLGLPIDS